MNNISLYQLFRLFIKNILAIILSAIVFGTAGFCYNKYFVKDVYAATGSIFVTNGGSILNQDDNKNTVQGGDISASINLTHSIKDILLTPEIYKALEKELGGKYTYSQLKGSANVTKRDDYTMFIDVKFSTNNKNDSILITNTFLKLAPNYINTFIPSASSTTTMADGARKVSPNASSTAIIGALIGAVLSYLIFFIISLNNVTIENEEDFKENYDIPVLGNIPDFTEAQNDKYANYYRKGGSYYGSYK